MSSAAGAFSERMSTTKINPDTKRPASPPKLTANHQLADEISKFYADPLGFVLFAYPWGELGPLENETGPDDNQRSFLIDLGKEVEERGFDGSTPVEPIRMAETSGHGTGKSVRGAWIAGWILSTRINSIGTVTAGTYTQLEGRTWAAIQHWMKLCITAHWFDIRAGGIFHKNARETWKILPQTCRPENAQSFAGQHARTSTSWYMADEASQVDDEIFTTIEGGLTDGEPMVFMWGQPVRNSGKLHRVCFGSEQARWNVRRVDSRNSRFTNKELIQQWISDYGEDSDFVRVRVLGLPPRASELQFIDQTRVNAAQEREAQSLYDDPLICGVDVSGGGEAWTVARFRKGFDARSIPPIRITGEETRNRDAVIGRLAEILRDPRPERKIAAMFIDTAFGAPIVERLRSLGYTQVHEVNFGDTHPPDSHDSNMRAYMWRKMKDWLLYGAIPSQKDDHKLESDLTGPGYHINNSGKLVLESKADMQKRGLSCLDDSDATALTFAHPVAPPKPSQKPRPHRYSGAWS